MWARHHLTQLEIEGIGTLKDPPDDLSEMTDGLGAAAGGPASSRQWDNSLRGVPFYRRSSGTESRP
jgi:hypothetical protein